MSSSVSTTTGGVVVVTHVHPTPQDGEPQRPVGIQKFVKGRPMILGTIQIIIGLMTLLFGIVMAINADTLGVFSGFFIWGALIYIAAGSLTVAAGKSLNRCQESSYVLVTTNNSVTSQAPPSAPLYTDRQPHPEESRDPTLAPPPPYTAVVN